MRTLFTGEEISVRSLLGRLAKRLPQRLLAFSVRIQRLEPWRRQWLSLQYSYRNPLHHPKQRTTSNAWTGSWSYGGKVRSTVWPWKDVPYRVVSRGTCRKQRHKLLSHLPSWWWRARSKLHYVTSLTKAEVESYIWTARSTWMDLTW